MKYIKKIVRKIVNIFVKPLIFMFYNVFTQKNIYKVIKGKQNSFFGYYNKCPWNQSQTKILSIKVYNSHEEADNISEAVIVLTDLSTGTNDNIAKTHCWNTQQGCMLQWLGPDFESKIIYNDFEEGKYLSKVFDVKQKKVVKIFDMPIYDVAANGDFALSLDFSRLHEARPGYGYRNIECKNKNELCPDEYCIWKIDLNSGKITPLIKYSDLIKFEFKETMNGAFHKVNHIVINPSGNRYMFLHRWINNGRKYTRLITCDIDTQKMYNLSDDDMVSHCCWKDDNQILGFMRKKEYGDHYYVLKDKTKEYYMIWKNVSEDGHCTYDYYGKNIVSDTYPNAFGVSKVLVGTEFDDSPKIIAKFYSPKVYKDDLRCDLHPRWNYTGDKICVDSVNDGYKKIYIINNRK